MASRTWVATCLVCMTVSYSLLNPGLLAGSLYPPKFTASSKPFLQTLGISPDPRGVTTVASTRCMLTECLENWRIEVKDAGDLHTAPEQLTLKPVLLISTSPSPHSQPFILGEEADQ